MSKFGSFSIDKLEDNRSSLYYTLYIDGKETWKATVQAPDQPEVIVEEVVAPSFWDKINKFF